MGVVTNVKETSGEGYDKVGTGDAGGQTIQLWEPGDGFKGEFSRSYMYMATTYQNFTWQGTQGLQQLENNTWPTLRPWAYTLYLAWSKSDRVDDVEAARNDAVYSLQGNRNVFIDYPYLCEYVWGDSVDVAFDPETSITTAYDDDRYLAQAQPAVAQPVITPGSGAYMEPQTVTLSCGTEGAAIYYTLDGSVLTRRAHLTPVPSPSTATPRSGLWPSRVPTRVMWPWPTTTSSAGGHLQLPARDVSPDLWQALPHGPTTAVSSLPHDRCMWAPIPMATSMARR
jgi:hypothetical protein